MVRSAARWHVRRPGRGESLLRWGLIAVAPLIIAWIVFATSGPNPAAPILEFGYSILPIAILQAIGRH
jgi:hypothetical protein